jgi:hypothetical protein
MWASCIGDGSNFPDGSGVPVVERMQTMPVRPPDDFEGVNER